MEEKIEQELLELLRKPHHNINDILDNYHKSDIADALPLLTKEERISLYSVIDNDILAEIFTYLDDANEYLSELNNKEKAAEILNEMDVDDAIDILEDLEDTDRKAYIDLLDDEAKVDIALIDSHAEDEIGSKMTTNFITVGKDSTIKNVMKTVVNEAPEHDNINIIYCIDQNNHYYGAIHLKDLIIARESTPLEQIIKTNYPTLYAHDKVSDVLEKVKEYGLDYLPVLNSQDELIGIITHEDIIEAVDEEMSEDYSKLAGLTEEIDEHEPFIKSVGKRIPWLCILLVFDLFISTIISGFENLIELFPIIAAFQSLLLDMSGNNGTQTLAVTIMSLDNEKLTFKRIISIISKELRIGIINGLILGMIATVFVGAFIMIFKPDSTTINGQYIHPFIISGVIGVTLTIGVIVASFIGCTIPMIFKSLKLDPATASGPFITSINDVVTILLYFGIVLLVFTKMFNII